MEHRRSVLFSCTQEKIERLKADLIRTTQQGH